MLGIFLLALVVGAGVWWGLAAAPSKQVGGDAAMAGRTVPANGWGPLKMMTANIRLDDPKDGDNVWLNRRDVVVKVFKRAMPEIIACQEVSPAQGAFLHKELGQWYDYYPRGGVGNLNPPASASAPAGGRGEGPAGGVRGVGAQLRGFVSDTLASLDTIYFRSDRFEILGGEAGLILPDELQAKPTENAFFTLAILREKTTRGEGPAYIVVDVHLRHVEPFAIRCAQRVREKIADWQKKMPGGQVIVMGDLNCDRTQLAYLTLTGTAPQAQRPDAAPTLADAYDYARKPAGEWWGNWHAFAGKPLREWPTDFVLFTGGQGGLRPTAAGAAKLVREQGDKGRWPSDHFFVVAELERVPK